MTSTASVQLSRYAVGVLIPWALITPLQFGQHIAALNQISKVLSCQVSAQLPQLVVRAELAQVVVDPNDCVAMSDNKFSFVTSVFMIVSAQCTLPAPALTRQHRAASSGASPQTAHSTGGAARAARASTPCS